MSDIKIEKLNGQYLVKADVTKQRLLDEGFRIHGMTQFDVMAGFYFIVSHISIHEMAVVPFKDNTKRKPPIARW